MNAELGTPFDTAAAGASTRYWAFLSYSHRDKMWAEWLHAALERYRVPKSLVGRAARCGTIPDKLTPIFRDRDELPASDDLGSQIRSALAASRYLIVLCSPAAATSRWTNEEIATFKRIHPDGCVLAAIVAGEPFASAKTGREAEECFPPALRQRFGIDGRPTGEPAEPIAADFREGADGKRLGLLKLIAGMLDVGLDELVQRETQRRQRRLTWIAAASLAGMVVTSGLAVAAVRARDEARDQRAQAEGLIGFMLGDLRSKLEPLGRLDVLDAVGAKALHYYQAQDRSSLTEEGLAQRSRALTLIGEIANLRGDLDSALQRYREALAGTAEALGRSPDDQQRIFDHAQNVFWVGYIAWQRGQTGPAEAAFREYKRLAERLVALDPNRPEWQLERVYADTNLGTVLLKSGNFAAAAAVFGPAVQHAERLRAADPRKPEYHVLLSETIAYLADAQEGRGALEEAIGSRERQLAAVRRMATIPGAGVEIQRQAMAAHRGLGRLLGSAGETETGIAQLEKAALIATELTQKEPDNTEWLRTEAAVHADHGLLLLGSGRLEQARRAIRASCSTADRLLERDPTVVSWTDAVRRCLILRAHAAMAAGSPEEALAAASRAVALGGSRQHAAMGADTRLLYARAQLAKGDGLLGTGAGSAALAAWEAGLAALAASKGEGPFQQSVRFALLKRLGRAGEAAAVAQRLDAIGYRHPAYVTERRKG